MSVAEHHQHESIASKFDSVCFQYGDCDAIIGPRVEQQAIGYTELQQASISLACQLYHRYRPTHVLLDLKEAAPAEAVAMLACNRIAIPFVPVSVVQTQHSGDRLKTIVSCLERSRPNETHIVAVVCCKDDSDPILTHFWAAGVHNVIYVNESGDLLEPMDVPQSLPTAQDDNLYILFTSGTSGNAPKAVIGSQSSTLHRLSWFAERFPPTHDTIVARRSKLTFVDAISELFSSLLYPPSTLYAFGRDELASRGVHAILSSPCTQVTMLPSQLEQLLLVPAKTHHSLQTIIVSGEPCRASILPAFTACFPSTTLLNLYGQTESTGDVLCAVLSEMENPIVNNVVAVGTPIPGVTVHTNNNTKELVVKGNLANGYLNDGQPFQSFCTGDVGFCRNGVWYVQGRANDVVKRNGHFVSPTMVETAFWNVYKVSCAVAIVKDTVVGVVDTECHFQRETMRAAGIPWHLIPKAVLVVPTVLPKSSGGAEKVDRAAITRIVREFLAKQKRIVNETRDKFRSVLFHVLGVSIEEGKSFVELGGDSALAITLLYKLRVAGFCNNMDVTAADILNSETVSQLRNVVVAGVPTKRRKIPDNVKDETFVAHDPTRFSDSHFAIDFKACVDAAPLVYGTDIYGACQGGVIQRIQKDKVISCHQLPLGWKVQAGMIIVDNSLIVCGYNDAQGNGIVVSLTLELCTSWTRIVNGPIKSTPIVVKDRVWVVAGNRLHILNLQNGDELCSLSLPSTTESRPCTIIRDGSPVVIYAFSDWNTGLGIVNDKGTTVDTIFPETGPVYANVLALDSSRVAVCDIAGYMHDVNVENSIIKSTKVASKPIFSGPVRCGDSIVFGSHDGTARCVRASDFSEQLWEYNAGAVIYSSPLAVPDDCFIICTTAGNVILIRKGKELSRIHMKSEIWSNPNLLGTNQIAVGARDSRLHIVKFINQTG